MSRSHASVVPTALSVPVFGKHPDHSKRSKFPRDDTIFPFKLCAVSIAQNFFLLKTESFCCRYLPTNMISEAHNLIQAVPKPNCIKISSNFSIPCDPRSQPSSFVSNREVLLVSLLQTYPPAYLTWGAFPKHKQHCPINVQSDALSQELHRTFRMSRWVSLVRPTASMPRGPRDRMFSNPSGKNR